MTVNNSPGPGAENEQGADDAAIGRAFRTSLILLVVLGGAAAGAYFYLTAKKPPEVVVKPGVSLPTVRERPKVDPPKIPFTDITKEAGISFTHVNGATGEKLLPETMGGGVAFFDYNNDGQQDLLFVNSAPWPDKAASPAPTMALYRNDGGKFSDVTAEAGLAQSFYGMGVACGDYDDDGWVDLFFSVLGSNRLYRNNQGKFEDATASAGLAGEADSWSTCCGWVDIDNDRDLDLFVGNYVRWSAETDRKLDCTLDGKLRAYCRPDAYDGAFPYLYRNEGNGKFTDISEEAGVRVQNPDTKVPLSKSLGLMPIDLDADGWMDLVVANDTVRNLVFHNTKDGKFVEIGIDTGIAFDSAGNARGAMGIDAARFRNDTTMGLAIGNFANEPTALYCATKDPMRFNDYAEATGIGPQSRVQLKFGVFFFDADLDGRQDLLTVNGHLDEDISKVQRSQTYEQAPSLFWNCGAKSSTEFLPLGTAECGKEFFVPLVGRGASYADIDADGDLDIVLTSTGGKPRLLRNDLSTGAHRLRVQLEGTLANRNALGAWVEVHADKQVLARQVMPTRSYLSQVELPVTFGLGKIDKVDKLVIHWPGGKTQEVKEVALDQVLKVTQPKE